MSQLHFTIITPTFNSGEKIVGTSASVFAQPQELYEYLIIDGGSDRVSLDYIRGLGSRARWISEADAGIYDAMNKGIRLAQGKLIYFLGAGDRLHPGVLRKVADQSTNDPEAIQFLYGDVGWPSVGRHGGAFTPARLARSNICHQAIFYDRRIFDLLGGFDLRYKICADHAMNIRCFGCQKIHKHHLDLIIADFEGGGVSEGCDQPFNDAVLAIAGRSLGLKIGLTAAFYHSRHFQWARNVDYHFHQPWRAMPAKILRRMLRTSKRM